MGLRILYVIPELGCGGAEILLGNICLEMNKQGHHVKVVSVYKPHHTYVNFPNKALFEEICKPEVMGLDVKIQLPSVIKIKNIKYENILQEFKPEVIHSHLFLAEILAHSYNYKQAVYFSHAHDNMYQLEPLYYKTRRKRKFYELLERTWLINKYKKFPNYFLSISNDALEFWQRVLPVKLHRKITLLHNAIDYEKFKSIPKNFNKNEFLQIVSTGNLVQKKNHILLIEIARILKNKGLNFNIKILGMGPLLEQLQSKIIEYKLEKEVTLAGNVGNVDEQLKNANLYIHPATYEPFGLAILEAMAAGLPVIAMNGHGNVELNIEGKTGYLINENNPDLFVEKILQLIDNPIHYHEISTFNIKFAAQFNIENYCRKLSELYHEALNN